MIFLPAESCMCYLLIRESSPAELGDGENYLSPRCRDSVTQAELDLSRRLWRVTGT